MYDVETYHDRSSWLSSRGLGGSDSTTILGLNPWRTPLELWATKTGRIRQPDLANLAMKIGTRMEPLAVDELEERIGDGVWRPGDRKSQHIQVRSRDRPWQTYSPDALTFRGRRPGWKQITGLIEAKWVGGRNTWTWEERSSEGAVRAEAQLQHGLAVLGLDGGYTCALLGADRFTFYEVERDDDVIDAIVGQEEEFLDHVKQDIPPASEFTEQSAHVLGKVLPYAARTRVVLDHPELVKDVEQMLEAQRKARQYETEYKELRTHMKACALTHAGMAEVQSSEPLKIEVPGVGTWSWKVVDVKGYTVAPKQREDFRKVKG